MDYNLVSFLVVSVVVGDPLFKGLTKAPEICGEVPQVESAHSNQLFRCCWMDCQTHKNRNCQKCHNVHVT